MTDQQTRNNHYVPQWYQRGFLASGQSRLFHLNLDPDRKTLPDGRQVPRTALHEWGSKNCFVEYDLYTTHFGPIVNDEVERYLFGVIDDLGAKAVRAFAPMPRDPLPFPSLLIASRTDPYCTYDRADDFAHSWGSLTVDAGESGHINVASGHGPWPEGLMRLAGFMKGL